MYTCPTYLMVYIFVFRWYFDEMRMITAFLKLHHDVDEAARAAFHALSQGTEIFCQYPPVDVDLF